MRGPAWRWTAPSFPAPRGTSFELRVRGDGQVDIADWSVYRRDRGVTLSSHGFVGASIGLTDRWNAANVTAELRQLSPALIILAFGTNEGFDPVDALGDYGSTLESRINHLKAEVPGASIVVIGPPTPSGCPTIAAHAVRCGTTFRAHR